ncbi:MAG TPA: hypothetical protein VFI42_02080 [Thermomicrobiaceae bacterium]|nr:hypothetical protein [Thermomicrobiaceae bacterium]
MHEHQRTIKIVLPDGELLTLLGAEVRFEPFYPESIRARLPTAEAEVVALVCLNTHGEEVARIKMNAIVGYLKE